MPPSLLLRSPVIDESIPTIADRSREGSALFGIRCPICTWRPSRSSHWTCWDCDHPEYFFNGCGTEWNTFETGGVCPTCAHRWAWTSCLSCWSWSKHVDWYENEIPTSAR